MKNNLYARHKRLAMRHKNHCERHRDVTLRHIFFSNNTSPSVLLTEAEEKVYQENGSRLILE